MEKLENNLISKLINLLSFKSAIAKKFSVYIIILIAIIIVILGFSVQSMAKVYDDNFKQSIRLTTKLLGNLLVNPINSNEMTFLEEFMNDLIDEKDIVYIIILSEDKSVLLSTIESYWGKHSNELGDKFSPLAADDTRLNLRQETDQFIKSKLYEDKKAIVNRITELKQNNTHLRYVGTKNDVDKKKTDLEVKKRILDEEIISLDEKIEVAESLNDSKKLDNLNRERTKKLTQRDEYDQLITSLNILNELLLSKSKKDKIIDRMPSDNMIYEVSVPVGGVEDSRYGILRIGYSPKRLRVEVNKMYMHTFAFGAMFVLLGLGVSFHLARTITKPLGELAKGAEILGSGNLYHQINIKTGDEMEILADRFNTMAVKLNESYSSLEQKVQERTREYLDATKELQRAYRKLQKTQAQLVQSEKMTSLGQLVAGVAHELNNPIGFITSNMQPLEDSLENLLEFLKLYKTFNISDEEKQLVEKFVEENDFEFMLEDLHDLIDDIKEGAKRAHKIVLDLRNFSRLDEAEYKEVDVHRGIDSTLNLLSKHYKHRVVVHKEYGDIPLITCYASQLNQVWMNLLVNAAQAIDETGDVYITTFIEGDKVVVKIRDTGSGIPEEVLERIFDPFFTTKPVGEGTGLGLSISHSIIEKHEGTIDIDSKMGEGTTFIIKLPIRSQSDLDSELEDSE